MTTDGIRQRRRRAGVVTTVAVATGTAGAVGWAATHPVRLVQPAAAAVPTSRPVVDPAGMRAAEREVAAARAGLARVRRDLPRLARDADRLPRATSTGLPPAPVSGPAPAVRLPAAAPPAPAAPPAAPPPPVHTTTGASGAGG